MAGKISDDVPHFLKWFHTVREKPASKVENGGAEAQPSGAPAAADDDVSTTLLIVGCFALASNIASTFAMTAGITFSASGLKLTAVA